ncbi:phospholipase D [Jaminaea rosea]|uniref:Phospholipase n=1 Tax=Jaminaea rosea TaxID=1569628 RepID=A0A316UYT0_9BASI|nr:phospholipase D [Jaminaea rosea]PWN28305.1 phospholipase D [Jaminaea rosea]
MTAAGSSLPDALHQVSDAAAWALGLSGNEDPKGGDGGAQAPQDGDDDDHDSDDDKPKIDEAKDEDGNPAGTSGKTWFGSLLPGLGNHANDPANAANDAYYHDSVGNDSRGEEEKGKPINGGQKSNVAAAGRKDDALARALHHRPQPQGHRDDEDDEEHRKVDPKSVDCQENQDVTLSSANPVDEAVQSERNDAEYRGKHPEAYPEQPQHEEHPAHRGPMWASRPDDAQRQKIKEMKQKRKQAHKEERRRARKEEDGSQVDEGEGNDDSHDTTATRPQADRTTTAGSSRFRDIFFSKAPRTAASNDDDEEHARRGLRGAFGAGASEQEEDQAQGEEEGGNQNDKANDSKAGDGVAPQSSSGGDDKMKKISGVMLGRDGEGKELNGSASLSKDDKWAILKQRVQATGAVAKRRAEKSRQDQRRRVTGGLDMTAELQSGVLPVILLKMALERDEGGHRRVPVLLNHLRLKVTDSVNPLHNSQAIFRIELSYADDVLKWVIYRSLGDFLTLHTHYRAAALRGYVGKAVGGDSGTADGDVGLPRFPKTSLPYLRQLQSQGRMRGEEGRRMFAKFQRDALEDYIIELVKRVMFRPEANRLCKFFELSALGISLATRGGFSGKQGFLRVLSKGGRKKEQSSLLSPMHWIHAQEPKWFIVRESYIAICPGPETHEIHDVFLIDGEFRIERPKRIYKQAASLAVGGRGDDSEKGKSSEDTKTGSDDDGKKGEQGVDSNKTALLTEGQWSEQSVSQRNGANTDVSSHTFYIMNAERKLKLSAKSYRILEQFVASIERVALHSPFSRSNRFGSFAPIRLNVNAQWLIDGRDYYWEVSRALLLAKDRIMIHDWWLSPELYLRRPGQPKWRLDNILQKKAREGVKVFVILYNEVSNNFTPTDSGYSKSRLTALHPNIYVQRSPSHFQTGTFYWAHHEKMCAIDETIAFMGGFDLCFGRYDTPAHVLVDDVDADYNDDAGVKSEHLLGPATEDGREAHIWPGQDYANERVAEWSDLTKPAQDLFDRTRFPRMPWHDTGLQLIGQPARDLCRHFTQRWNFLLRNKNHKRKFPFLVPAPDFTPQELDKFQLTGTCEVQICRSAGPWSLGTNKTVEHSIQNAYLKCIQMSEHFVYIENQFFVTSTQVEGTMIENNIGNALVSRIIRAHREGTKWRAVVVIPLIPGFPMPISEPDASSVRIICDCQFRSICRGEHSIYGKLRREGIDADDYISFFSLRNWGKLKGGQLTTEQVYIHGKCAVFDDRIAIIGSANINERSQRGDRDSELACIIRDTDMLDSTMAGKPYKVGRFAHTMRIRLMREHLGVDVDAIEQREAANDAQEVRKQDRTDEDDMWDPDREQQRGSDDRTAKITKVSGRHRAQNLSTQAGMTITDAAKGAKAEAMDYMSGKGTGEGQNEMKQTGNDVHANDAERSRKIDDLLRDADKGEGLAQRPELSAGAGVKTDDDDGETVGHASEQKKHEELEAREEREDDHQLSTTVEERHLAEAHTNRHERAKSENPEDPPTKHRPPADRRHRMDESASAPILNRDDARRRIEAHMSANPWAPPLGVPTIDEDRFEDPVSDSFYKDMWLAAAIHNTQIYRKVFRCVPDDTVTTWSEYKAFQAWGDRLAKSGHFSKKEDQQARQDIPPEARAQMGGGTASGGGSASAHEEGSEKGDKSGSHKKTTSKDHSHNPAASAPSPGEPANDGGFSERELQQMEALLDETVGNLVIFPTRFLETEDRLRNFLFPLDVIQPLTVFA